MNTLPKLIASVAALIASLSLAWIAKNGLDMNIGLSTIDARLGVHGDGPSIRITKLLV